MPRTVLSVVSTLGRTGPINVLKGIVRHYNPARFKSVIVTLSPEGRNSQIEEFRALNIPIIPLHLSRVQGLLQARKRLIEVAARTEASIVHCHGIRATLLARCPEFADRAIATVHCDLNADYRLAYGRLLGFLMARREYSALKRFRAVIAVSPSANDALNINRIDSVMIMNGIDIAKFSFASAPSDLLNAKNVFGWEKARTVVLHTGLLIPRKRPLDVIEAFLKSDLSKTGILAFAGDGPIMDECRHRARECINIQFLGFHQDASALLNSADVLVSASSSEGMPMSLLEGCASGIEIVASNIAPHRQLQELFPELVQTFRAGYIEELIEVFNRIARRGRVDRKPVSAARLDAISDKVMSTAYQSIYGQL